MYGTDEADGVGAAISFGGAGFLAAAAGGTGGGGGFLIGGAPVFAIIGGGLLDWGFAAIGRAGLEGLDAGAFLSIGERNDCIE